MLSPLNGVGVLGKPALADSSVGESMAPGSFSNTSWPLLGPFSAQKRPRERPESEQKNKHVRKITKTLAFSLQSADVGPTWYKQVFKHIQNVVVGEMGLSMWKLLPHPSHLFQPYPAVPSAVE